MMKRILEGLLSIVYPEGVACHACGAEAEVNERGICASCEASLVPYEGPGKLASTDGFTAGLIYTEEIAAAIQRFKYNDARYLAEFLASFIAIPEDWDYDAIVPVPLHRRRLRRRGYNQSALLANKLSVRYGAPVREDLIRRARHTKTQTKLDARQRLKNLAGAFSAAPEANGLRLLLVDDVRTTGATLTSCAKALREAGAVAVYACTVCERARV